jgi:hypothetical protein
MTHYQTFTNGLFGLLGSTFGVLSTFQEQLDWGVRITGGCIGLAVGAVSLYRLIKLPK